MATIEKKGIIILYNNICTQVTDVMCQKLHNNARQDLTDKKILSSMASTMRNARDWDGHRLIRNITARLINS